MRLAILSDVHANREALESVLADIAAQEIDQLVFLGDIVGFGPDPSWCVDRVAELVAEGALCLRGNHDRVVAAPEGKINSAARRIIDWTLDRLNARQRLFLGELPFEIHLGEALFVHASADQPDQWQPISDATAAARSFDACQARLIFCGHRHHAAIYSHDLNGKVCAQSIAERGAFPLLASRRWLAVMGSVGQPRDGTQLASYAIWDQPNAALRFRQIGYDVDTTVQKARAVGLPEAFARRLITGI